MEFKRAKKVLEKTVPGLGDLLLSYITLSNLVAHLWQSVAEAYQGQRDFAHKRIDDAEEQLGDMLREGYITKDTHDKMKTYLDTLRKKVSRQSASSVEKFAWDVQTAINRFVAKDLARYARAPKVVSTKRKVRK